MRENNELKNILFVNRVRSKKKKFWNLFYWYYEDEKISLKEKIYTLQYNMEKTGYLTKGELDWAARLMQIDYMTYEKLVDEFKKDYIEFLQKSPKYLG